jgi:hypothetical protein
MTSLAGSPGSHGNRLTSRMSKPASPSATRRWLPPRRGTTVWVAWTRLAQRQTFQAAVVSADLRQLALDVMDATLESCRAKLLARCVAPPVP